MGWWLLVAAVVLVIPVGAIAGVLVLGLRAEGPGPSRGVLGVAYFVVGIWGLSLLLTWAALPVVALYGAGLGAYALDARRDVAHDRPRASRARRSALVLVAAALVVLACVATTVMSARGIVTGWDAVAWTVFLVWVGAPLIGMAVVGVRWARRDLVGTGTGIAAAVAVVAMALVPVVVSVDVPLRLQVGLRRDAMDEQARRDLEARAQPGHGWSDTTDLAGFAVRGNETGTCTEEAGASTTGVRYWLVDSSNTLAFCPTGAPRGQRGAENHVHLGGQWWIQYASLAD